MTFQIHALPEAPFADLFALTDADLAAQGARRVTVDASPGFPCRVSLADAAVGDTVILMNYQHQPDGTAFRASHAIYVREGAREARPAPGVVPDVMARRLLSVRGFDANHDIVDADVVDGQILGAALDAMFENAAVAYAHVHYAKPGCFAAKVTRA